MEPTQAIQRASHPTITVMLGGDVMLGRLVAHSMRRHGHDYPLAPPVAERFRAADLAIVNLECALTSHHQEWPGAPKDFYFSAPKYAVKALAAAGIDCVNLANNHALDFDVVGLKDTIAQLEHSDIRHVGAGLDQASAEAPVAFQRGAIHIAITGFCDHQPDYAARNDSAGIAYLDLVDESFARWQFTESLATLKERGVDWPILSLHWGPNLVERPSAHYRRLAHAAIDAGWRIIYGHSAHVFQGVELYKGGAIFYGTGNLVDDYFVDPDFRNDCALAFELTLTKSRIARIDLHPLLITQCQARPAATGMHGEYEVIAGRIALIRRTRHPRRTSGRQGVDRRWRAHASSAA